MNNSFRCSSTQPDVTSVIQTDDTLPPLPVYGNDSENETSFTFPFPHLEEITLSRRSERQVTNNNEVVDIQQNQNNVLLRHNHNARSLTSASSNDSERSNNYLSTDVTNKTSSSGNTVTRKKEDIQCNNTIDRFFPSESSLQKDQLLTSSNCDSKQDKDQKDSCIITGDFSKLIRPSSHRSSVEDTDTDMTDIDSLTYSSDGEGDDSFYLDNNKKNNV